MIYPFLFSAFILNSLQQDSFSQPIIGGATVPVGRWNNVVAVINIESLNQANGLVTLSLCSGVLLDLHTVLTAGHCLLEISKVENMAVVFGEKIYVEDSRFIASVKAFAVHPDICLEDKCGEDAFDFGLITLADQVGGVEIIKPLVTQEEWDENMQVSDAVTVVGFGATQEVNENDLPQENYGLGIKREVSVGIRQFSSTGFEFIAGNQGKDICGGDSGGPVFAQLADGNFRLVGISSRGVAPCGTGTSYYGTVYAALPWIRDEVGLDLLPEGCDDRAGDTCLDPRPPPSGCQISSTRSSSNMLFLSLMCLFLALCAWRKRFANLEFIP